MRNRGLRPRWAKYCIVLLLILCFVQVSQLGWLGRTNAHAGTANTTANLYLKVSNQLNGILPLHAYVNAPTAAGPSPLLGTYPLREQTGVTAGADFTWTRSNGVDVTY